jgi:DNA-binding CsgD family transcriptional regulator
MEGLTRLAGRGGDPSGEVGLAVDLLERASFLNALAEYAAEARNGDGRLVLVSGESGIGKTALLEAFQRRGKGTRWLWGACDGLLTPRPLGPLLDIGPQAGGELAELCRQEAPRDRLFAAFAAELSSPAFAVAAIEDVHWADEATVDLLSFLGRRLGRMAALVLVTYRDDEVGEDHPLRVALGDLATQRATRRIRLPPLSAAAVRALAGQRDVDAAELHRVTGGNPFYVTEILAAGWPSVPATVRDAIGARLARATPAARRAVEAAAVIGTRVGRSLLSSVLGGAEGAADDCVATGVLVAEETGFRFRHELARMAVEAAIAPGRKRELHACVLAALQEHSDADPAVLAHHAEGAGDAAVVLQVTPRAALRAVQLASHREAAAQYERALRFAAGEDAATRASLYAALAREDSLIDRFEEAEVAGRAALQLYRQVGDRLGEGDMQRRLSRVMWRLCRGADAVNYANAAVATLEPLGVTEQLAWAYCTQAYLTRSMPAAQRAQQLAEELQQPSLLSDALNTEAVLRFLDDGQWAPMMERALRIALDAGAVEQAGRAYSNLGEMLFVQRRLAESERYFRDGMAYCEAHEVPTYVICLRGWRANVLEQLGRWDEAATLCTATLETTASPVNRLTSLVALGLIRARRGDASAGKCLDEAIENARGTLESGWIAMAALARAEARWLEGNPAAARDELAAVYEAAIGEGGFVRGALAAWLRRTGSALEPPPGQAAGPHALALAGQYQEAAEAWDRLGCQYEAALALFDAQDETSLREALRRFDGLGATAAANLARRALRALGARQVPAGARAAARAHPLGLTGREQEVLALLAEGLPDREIAQRLVISERTVHHHVSAVLSKTGAASRAAAARAAVRLGTGAPA